MNIDTEGLLTITAKIRTLVMDGKNMVDVRRALLIDKKALGKITKAELAELVKLTQLSNMIAELGHEHLPPTIIDIQPLIDKALAQNDEISADEGGITT